MRQSEKLSTAAKLTHRIYGTISHAAAGAILEKITMVARIAIQSRTISPKAHPGWRRPKNKIDQSVFKTSCTPKAIKAWVTQGV